MQLSFIQSHKNNLDDKNLKVQWLYPDVLEGRHIYSNKGIYDFHFGLIHFSDSTEFNLEIIFHRFIFLKEKPHC